jgi:hypothetical protein
MRGGEDERIAWALGEGEVVGDRVHLVDELISYFPSQNSASEPTPNED